MKKLLHEKLRDDEAIYEGCITTDSGKRVTDLYKSEMEALADEIEKYYIPRPRFEDGEPVQFGDEYKWADANIRKITGFGVTENGAPYVTCAFDGLGMSDAMIYSGSLKRPKPKVLDSLEKLRDDMIDLCGTDGEDSSLICDELADCAARLTALIERGA